MTTRPRSARSPWQAACPRRARRGSRGGAGPGLRLAVRRLQPRRHLARVQRIDARVRRPPYEAARPDSGAGAHVVIGRVRAQPAELRSGRRASRTRGSRAARSGSGGSGACRAAGRRRRPRGRAPAAASARRRPAGRRSSRPEIARRLGWSTCSFAISHSAAAMKSSNTFCLLLQHPGAVPVLAVLAAAAQVRRARRRRRARGTGSRTASKVGSHADVEAAVAGQQRGLLAVAPGAFAVGEEHRHAGAVPRRHHRRARPRTTRRRPALPTAATTRRRAGRPDVDAKDFGRDEKRGEAVADLGDVARAGERRERAQSRQRDVCARLPVGEYTRRCSAASCSDAAAKPPGSRRPP